MGVLGNSIAAGVNVARKETWPSQLQAMHTHGRAVRVLNRAVRASRADFAALCFEELVPRTTHLDVAVIDYSYTSNTVQILALVDKLHSMGVPTIVLLYCPHTGWLRFVHCGLWSNGYCNSNVNQTRIRRQRPVVDEWATATAPPIQRAGERVPGRGLRADFGSSLSNDAIAVGQLMQTKLVGCRRHVLDCLGVPLSDAANATFERLHRLRMDARAMGLAQHRFYASGLRAAADPGAFAGVEGVLAAAAAASFIRGQLSHSTTAAAALLRDAVNAGLGVEPRKWMDALSAVAAGECLSSAANVELVATLAARGVPYVSNAAQLSMLAEEVLARKGAWGAHPNALGHQLMASAVDGMLRSMMRARPAAGGGGGCAARRGGKAAGAAAADPSVTTSAYPEQTCSYGQDALSRLVVRRRGFEAIDAGGEGRTGGLSATTAGASFALRVASRTLQGGWFQLGYERGMRNVAMAQLSCVAPCACPGLTVNATNPKPYTGTAFTPSMWLVLGHAPSAHGATQGGYECVLRVDVTAVSAGRLLVQAATLSAPLPGNLSVGVKDSLQVAAELKAFDPFEDVRAPF